jgi:hypothetical protein
MGDQENAPYYGASPPPMGDQENAPYYGASPPPMGDQRMHLIMVRNRPLPGREECIFQTLDSSTEKSKIINRLFICPNLRRNTLYSDINPPYKPKTGTPTTN